MPVTGWFTFDAGDGEHVVLFLSPSLRLFLGTRLGPVGMVRKITVNRSQSCSSWDAELLQACGSYPFPLIWKEYNSAGPGPL